MTELINNVHEIGQWTIVKINLRKKKPNATKFIDNRTFSFVANIAKIVARILRKRKGRNMAIHVEKMSLDIQEQMDAGSDITTNCGHR